MLARLAEFDRCSYLLIVDGAREHGLNKPALLVSASGDGPLYIYLCVALMLFDSRGEELLRLALAAFLLELPLYLLLKNSIRRTRPCHSAIGLGCSFEPSDKFSLPSGHTAAAFVMAGAIGSIYPAAILPLYLWASLIGLSRVALGVHYPMDILAGAALGSLSVVWADKFI
ncbi:phosphatase PAP2 family protein [Shewanella litorisediminis]|uniref:undecaprenyl-diphosphate phosphatase n=1 Tax=Shewanella litorisediminis TaxID=1173586 RepID=A0ABX7G2E1_9GAMM|nr:phosphatase PAP2 family protein [Shewanella litorisediminis]MCL2918578.1 phosphatase PAP2 family protein [Shewanella litorisediminis]QRH01402.1 phosphatase PAP2 family protein [Shewanella litorisediminis]